MSTIDDVRVSFAGQSRPLIARDPETGAPSDCSERYRNETACALRLRVRTILATGFRFRVECSSAKDFKQAVRYFEVTGLNG